MKQLFIRCIFLLLLICYEPIVEGYLYFYIIPGNSVLQFLRQTSLATVIILFMAALVGRNFGWLTAPMVCIVSGVWYAFAEVGFRGDRDFEENIFFAWFFAIVLAFPIGLIVSLISWRASRKQIHNPM